VVRFTVWPLYTVEIAYGKASTRVVVDMTLQVGGVSKIESMKCAQLITTDPTSRQRRRPTSLNQKPSKNNSRKEKKLVVGPKGVPDTKTD
jgi:hypothetical protein